MNVFHKNRRDRHWILDYGFEKESRTVVGKPCQYETCVHSKSGLYCLWIGVDFESLAVHIYIEYDCGGEIYSTSKDFSDVDVDHEDTFMSALDELVSEYLEVYE